MPTTLQSIAERFKSGNDIEVERIYITRKEFDELTRTQWQPIASAPKDGSQFLIWTKRLGYAVVTHDVEDPMPADIVPSGHRLRVDDGKYGPYPIRGDYPTHWQPLPPPPGESQ